MMRRNVMSGLIPLVSLFLSSAVLFSCGPRGGSSRRWQAAAANSYWRAAVEPVPDGSGNIRPAVVLSFSGYASTRPGDHASVKFSISRPDSGPAGLTFFFCDGSPDSRPSGLFFEVLAGGTVLFREQPGSVSARSQDLRFDLPPVDTEGRETTLEFRLVRGSPDDRVVVQDGHEWFIGPPSIGYFLDPVVRTSEGVQRLLPDLVPPPLPPLPPDPPLAALPTNGLKWTKDARIVQPWGETQWDAIVRAPERAPWLSRTFGFNTMIILPPDAHNAITPPSAHISEKEFERALEIYRANGFRIIMYTSIMHCGHAPVWQDGTLEATHPEWSQRGPKGEPIRIYGRNWLCPSTGALPYTLDYTAGLVRRYNPDLVMLDNSEFFATPSGVSCHCPGCQVEFRRYLRQRFGETVAGRSTDEIAIPTETGFLYDLWISWRNRVWGEAHEIFRRELRRIKPDIVLMSNTQYLRQSPDLATDRIYAHEDALISESVGMTMDGMIDKLLLGKALSGGKPVWNYLGTFKVEDYERLVSPDEIAMNVSTAYACRVRPWIVYRGFYEKPLENRASLDRLESVIRWHHSRESALADLEPYAPVLSLVSLNSRNCRFSRIVPGHLTPLRRRGVCSRLIEERAVETGVPESCRVLLIEDAPCLSEAAVRAIAHFITSGGRVVASPNTAWYDELGRLRPRSALWQALGLKKPPEKPVKVGLGEVRALRFSDSLQELETLLDFARFRVGPGEDCSLLPYVDGQGDFVVYICSDKPLSGDLKIEAPDGRKGRAIVCVSTEPVPFIVTF